jgi:hypothetical protein
VLPASGNPPVSGFDVPNVAALLGEGLSVPSAGLDPGPCIELSLPLVFSFRAP